MKIGILTYHHVNNDGAILQTLGHLYTLKDLFPEAQIEVIDYRSLNMEISEWILALKSFLPWKGGGFSKTRKLLYLKSFVSKQVTLSSSSVTTNDWTKASAFIEKQNYDAIIVGSDEVWKVLNKKYSRKFPNIYWLPLPLKAAKIGSAASANKSDESLIKQDIIQQQMRTFLNDFKRIAVRDQFTFDLVCKNVNDISKVYQVPDPTFGIDFNTEVRQKLIKLGVDFNKKVVALSFSSNPIYFSKIAETLRIYADQNNIQLVAIGQQNKFAHLDITGHLNPLEWASCYKHFNFCITDRFHSAIFSIKNIIPFLAIELSSKYDGSYKGKVVDLLTKCSMMNAHRFVSKEGIDIINLMNELEKSHNPDAMKNVVNEFKVSFRSHLKESILSVK
jgi:polysaccharide pyruvyl transferase WcaK-like protein